MASSACLWNETHESCLKLEQQRIHLKSQVPVEVGEAGEPQGSQLNKYKALETLQCPHSKGFVARFQNLLLFSRQVLVLSVPNPGQFLLHCECNHKL